MKNTEVDIAYDTEADMLEIFVGKPSPTSFEEIEDDLFEGRDEETGELRGYKLFNIRSRGGSRAVKLSLPLDGLLPETR